MRRVGVIGLGGMGTALTRSLMAAGRRVACFDIRRDAVTAMVDEGAEPADSARALAARCDVVLSSLPGPRQVREVALDPDAGVLAGLRPGAAMLDMSTCGPDLAEHLGVEFEKAGRRFVDCPVSGIAPTMTILVGGRAGVLGPDEAELSAVSRVIVHCGRRGAGYAVKLLNQHVKYSWYLASAEALLVAEALGLDAETVASGIEQSSGGASGFSAAAKYFRGDAEGMRTHAPASTIEKDLALAEAMASRAGVRSRVLGEAVDFFLTVGGTPFRGRPYPESSELLRALRAMPPETGAPS